MGSVKSDIDSKAYNTKHFNVLAKFALMIHFMGINCLLYGA